MILDKIVARSRLDLEERKKEVPLEEVQARAAAQAAPRDAMAALRARNAVHVIAEVKRASPSKGLLAPNFDPVGLARTYAASGASLISVLTEPHFFQGAPSYLTAIKQAVEIPVLCKDFLYDEYQVYEARSWGADLILLICAILDDGQLRHLLGVARSLNMHALVEAHSAAEVQRAVAAGAQIIGVNSRDLRTFEMQPGLIRDLRPLIPAECVLVAESGIHSAADARRLARYDVQAMLVGESLVTSNDIPGQLRRLLRGANEDVQIKICGLSDERHVKLALEAGADLFGLVFYEPSHRYVTPRRARELAQTPGDKRAQIEAVGLFVNKEADFINEVAELVGLDVVQLHGDESPELCQRIRRPVIKAIHMRDASDLEKLQAYREVTWRVLLDTPSSGWGGSGETHDWQLARAAAQTQRAFLAGGLHSANVAAAIAQVRPWGVDVSSGVESAKVKDEGKMRDFIAAVRRPA
ncbi:MAG TPA: bifunctional indole-3-glycerol-phosphate synthase TrpC/phosphoribosylanthranilate isomerase TrpF [Ktedonobacteraceae bacterium]|nr:bifunctional indole-3-glycerol-phosphate synthase TrpC/phosphoribosylanthranilate isomerase TrpF [Ktedonobacteraceae bacterium]